MSNTTAWVDADGSYGVGDLLVFHEDAITIEQWNFMTDLPASQRILYVQAILEGDLDTVATYHSQQEDN